jgi:hypothetical protein
MFLCKKYFLFGVVLVQHIADFVTKLGFAMSKSFDKIHPQVKIEACIKPGICI